MKTIVAGIDFTPSSLNAGLYAALLAQKLNCKLTVFNLFNIPALHSNSGFYFMSYASKKKLNETKMDKLIRRISRAFPDIQIEKLITSGSFKTEIKNFVASHRVETVVLGLSSKTRMEKLIYGSHSTDIAGQLISPVIIVPEKYKKHKLNSILLSVDNNEKLYHSSLNELEKFAADSKAKLQILWVKTEHELFVPKQKELIINGVIHKINTIRSKDIEKGVLRFSGKNKADLIAIISKKHSALYNLFAESHTKKMVYASKVPVMAIHD